MKPSGRQDARRIEGPVDKGHRKPLRRNKFELHGLKRANLYRAAFRQHAEPAVSLFLDRRGLNFPVSSPRFAARGEVN